MNKIKEKIERRTINNILQNKPQVANTVNVSVFEIKHRNVLEKKYPFISIE